MADAPAGRARGLRHRHRRPVQRPRLRRRRRRRARYRGRWKGEGVEERGYDREGRCIVSVDPRYFRPAESRSSRRRDQARSKLGWTRRSVSRSWSEKWCARTCAAPSATSSSRSTVSQPTTSTSEQSETSLELVPGFPSMSGEAPVALVTGVRGQDGGYMAQLLRSQGRHVIGTIGGPSRSGRRSFGTGKSSWSNGPSRPDRLVDLLRTGRPSESTISPLIRPVGKYDDPLAIAEVNGLAVTASWRRSERSTRDPLLPGVEQRDVRPAAGESAARGNAVQSAQSLRRGKLYATISSPSTAAASICSPARRSCSTMRVRTAPSISSLARSARRSRRSSLAWRRSFRSAISTPGATGALPATRFERCS